MRIRETIFLCLFHFLRGKRQAVGPKRVYVQFKGNTRSAESGCKQERVFDRDFLIRGSMPQENRRRIRGNILLQREELPLPFPDQIPKAFIAAPALVSCDDRIAQYQCVRHLQAKRVSVHTERRGKMRTGRKPADIYRQSGMCIPLSFHRIRQCMQRPQAERLRISRLADRIAQDLRFKAQLLKGARNGLALPRRETDTRRPGR